MNSTETDVHWLEFKLDKSITKFSANNHSPLKILNDNSPSTAYPKYTSNLNLYVPAFKILVLHAFVRTAESPLTIGNNLAYLLLPSKIIPTFPVLKLP